MVVEALANVYEKSSSLAETGEMFGLVGVLLFPVTPADPITATALAYSRIINSTNVVAAENVTVTVLPPAAAAEIPNAIYINDVQFPDPT